MNARFADHYELERTYNQAIDAIHRLLDECERVGPLKYEVPTNERVQRATLDLHEAVGRNA